MPVQRNQPSPQRQHVLSFVSPNVQDILFYETVDAQRVGMTPEQLKNSLPKYGTKHPDTTNFPNHVLAYIRQADPNGQFYQYFYVNERETQDNYNFEHSQANLGQTKFDTVVRTYVYLRSSFEEGVAALSAGTAMPLKQKSDGGDGWEDDTTDTFYNKGYILMGREQKRIGDKELDGIFVVEQRVYFIPTTITTHNYDDLSHNTLMQAVDYLYHGQSVAYKNNAGESASGTVQTLFAEEESDYLKPQVRDVGDGLRVGFYREGRQVSSDWYEVITKDVIAGEPIDTKNIKLDEYDTVTEHTFPPVLQSIKVISWERHDGQMLSFPEYHMNPEAYRGPCKTTVVVKWSPDPFTQNNGGKVESFAMQPQSFTFGTPYVRISVPPCLTKGRKISCTSGTVDPVYKYTVYTKKIRATVPPTWPSTHVARDKQEVARGGYIRTTWTVHKPTYSD